jgi:hypothetical protein
MDKISLVNGLQTKNMFCVILRCLGDEYAEGRITTKEYQDAIIKLAELHEVKKII